MPVHSHRPSGLALQKIVQIAAVKNRVRSTRGVRWEVWREYGDVRYKQLRFLQVLRCALPAKRDCATKFQNCL